MAKFASNGVYDGGFNTFKAAAGTVTQTLCSAQPTTYAQIATYKLASVTIDKTNDLTVANGDTSGRKLVVAAKTGVPVTTSGTATHAVLDNGTDFFVTTTPSTAVAGTVDIGTWKDEVQAPA